MKTVGLAYSIYSTSSFFEDTGDLVISAGLDTDNVAKDIGPHSCENCGDSQKMRLRQAELRRAVIMSLAKSIRPGKHREPNELDR